MSVVNINDYLENENGNFADAFRCALKNTDGDAAEIVLKKQVYHIYPQNLDKREIFVSNTNSEDEGNITRSFGMLLEGKKNICVRGNGATVLMHGKLTQIGIIKSKYIVFENVTLNTCHPTVTEMRVTHMEDGYLECEVNKNSLYEISDGHIRWYGENFSFSQGISQIYDPVSGITRREWGPMQDSTAVFEEIAPGKIKINYGDGKGRNPYKVKSGDIFQMRDALRDECGILIFESENITLKNVAVNYMHGMGLIVQNSSDITVKNFKAEPEEGRTNSCFADVMHFSGCRGRINIEGCRAVGAQDDAINVHGTHLRITKSDSNGITVRFEHPQTVGIGGFAVGDEVACVNPDTLQREVKSRVTGVIEISPRELKLHLERNADLFKTGYVIENLSAYPQVFISDNYFERIPTRGILVTSAEKTVIKNNVFNKIKGCGVLIADDAKSWFESGAVNDVEISGNEYSDNCGCFVKIYPENSIHNGAVHKNIKIKENKVFLSAKAQGREDALFISAKSSDNLDVSGNKLGADCGKCVIELENCGNASVKSNEFSDGKLIVVDTTV